MSDVRAADYVGFETGTDDAAERERFAAIVEQLRPECERVIAQYEDARSALLPILHLFQNEQGWVSPAALRACAQLIDVPLSVVESTASFYTLFFRRPVGRYMLQPCRGVACIIRGAEEQMAHFRERLGIGHLETTDDGLFSYEEVECLAACDRAPCMQVNLEFVYDLTNESIDAMLGEMRAGTCAIARRTQTSPPRRTWIIQQDSGKKSAGAQDVLSPDDPGGIGDRSGKDMLRRIERDPELLLARPTRERLVRDGVAILDGEAEKH